MIYDRGGLVQVVPTSELKIAESNRLLIGRIAASSHFQKAPRLREFLLFVADCTLSGRLDDAREQSIAENVFKRKADYAAQDSIVRAEARNLRRRLESYFATEAPDEPVVVVMPKGAYTLVFRPRVAADSREVAVTASGNGSGIVESAPLPPPPSASVSDHSASQFGTLRRYRLLCVALLASTITFGGLAGLAVFNNAKLKAGQHPVAQGLPFSALFGNGRDTFIVTSDTALLQVYSATKRGISLDEYITRSYADFPGTFPHTQVRRGEYTDGQEMAIAAVMLQHNAPFLFHTFLRSGHQLQLSDFKSHNVILLGSKLSNPWAALYEDNLVFRADLDLDTSDVMFRNVAPQGNERPIYSCCENNHSYARIAFVPNSPGLAPALLVAGVSAESTAAAGEFVLDEARMEKALRAMGINPAGPPRDFELLLKVTAFVGGATQSEVIASRTSRTGSK